MIVKRISRSSKASIVYYRDYHSLSIRDSVSERTQDTLSSQTPAASSLATSASPNGSQETTGDDWTPVVKKKSRKGIPSRF